MSVTPIRPGVNIEDPEGFASFFREKLARFAEHHGLEPRTIVIVMWNGDGEDFAWQTSVATSKENGIGRIEAHGTAAALLLKNTG